MVSGERLKGAVQGGMTARSSRMEWDACQLHVNCMCHDRTSSSAPARALVGLHGLKPVWAPVGLLLVSQVFTRSCHEAVVSRGTSGRVTVTASVAAPLTEAPGSGLRIQLQT